MIAERPLISCIIAVFNGERFIAAAVDSVLAQTYRPIEVIVVDDGSTDRTAEIVAGYGDEVRLVTQEAAGPPATRNLGLAAATGEYLAFLDGDDLWHEEKLARQMACLVTEPMPDACVTHVKHFWMPELAEEEAELKNQPRHFRSLSAFNISQALVLSSSFRIHSLYFIIPSGLTASTRSTTLVTSQARYGTGR